MRTVVNISMVPKLRKEVDTIVKEHNYSSVSEFFRDALRAWKDEQLYRSVIRSEKEVAAGKAKMLHSLKDLM